MQTSATRQRSILARVLAAHLSRSFILLPSLISLAGLACAIVVILFGDHLEAFASYFFPQPKIETLRSVLSTIAGSALTVLSLVYSLTLVVFTLAAGNISPRLLSRFTEDSMIQATAGVLAATFFYAIVLLQRADTIAPATSSGVAVLWSIGSISLLIVFIRKVSTRVTIDEEIGRIGATLSEHIDQILDDSEKEDEAEARDRTVNDYRPAGKRTELLARRDGYIEAIDFEKLLKATAEHDLFIEVAATPGQFVVQGSALATYVGGRPADEDQLRGTFLIGRQRTPEADLDFSILLMVEIAQRALSPGVNDGFTAVAVIDHLSAAFGRILSRRAPSPLYHDTNDIPRIWCEIAEIDRLLNTAYHPLRREVVGNVTVALRLVASLHRLAAVTRPIYASHLERHIRLIVNDITASDMNPEDRESLISACENALAVLHLSPSGEEETARA